MADVYVVVTEDRHTDTATAVFTTEHAAVRYAEKEAANYDRSGLDADEADETLTASMREDGWVRYLPLNDEGDCIYVAQRVLRQA